MILSRDNIFKCVDSRYIIEFYLGRIDLRRNIKSPVRPDKKPSGRFYRSKKTSQVYFKDYAQPEASFDCFKLVMMLFNLGFRSALIKINDDLDLNLTLHDNEVTPMPSRIIIESFEDRNDETPLSTVVYKIKKRKFNKFDRDYWMRFNISIEILDKYNVFAVKTCFMQYEQGNEFKLYYKNLPTDPCYAYQFKHPVTGKYCYKLYRPLTKNPKFKWRYNGGRDIIQGLDQINYERRKDSVLLFNTSSLKDVMTLDSLGLNAIATSSENVLLDDNMVTNLSLNFDMISFMDYDKQGLKTGEFYFNKYGVPQIYTLNKIFKDPSDYCEKFKADRLLKLIQLKTNV